MLSEFENYGDMEFTREYFEWLKENLKLCFFK